MKSSRLLIVFLLFATAAQAQRSNPHSQPMSSSSGNGGLQWFGGGVNGLSTVSAGDSGVRYEAPRDYALGYAKNDGPFFPSTYINYDDAVALGRQQLAESRVPASANPPLGDVARAYGNPRTVPQGRPVPQQRPQSWPADRARSNL